MRLDERPVRFLISAIADAAARWKDAGFPPRARALDAVCQRTGYSEPVVEYAFDRTFESLTAPAIEAAIVAELGSLDVLDGFWETPGRSSARALPIGRVCIVASRTTIGVALVPAVFALCAKCTVVVKDREDALVGAFFKTLAEELDDFGQAAVARSWDGERSPAALDGFDAVVAFGSDDGLARISQTLEATTRFIPFGSKASCGYIGRDALRNPADIARIAEGAARDVVLYDTEGCLSLHALFVERDGNVEPAVFAEMLARAVERAAAEFPIGKREAADVARLAQARRTAEFRAATAGQGMIYADSAVTYLMIVDPPHDEPPLFLPRALIVRNVDGPADASAYIAEHRLPIEAVAIAGRRPDIRAMAIASGAARIAEFGTLQTPPLGGRHGGRPRIAEFVRWVCDES